MKFLFIFIAVCPAVLAAGTDCMKEGSSWKEFLLKTAGWFYSITFINMLLLYVCGRGEFDFSFLSAQFLFKYMLCSMAGVMLCHLAGKEAKTERFRRKIAALDTLVKKEAGIIKTNRAEKFYGLSAGIVTSCGISFLICVFAPLDLYFNNKGEFWFDVYTLLPLVIVMFIVAALAGIILSAVLFRLNKKIYQCVWMFGFVLFLCSYIQGNYLTKHLPPLDGTEFNWADYSAGKYESVILWCAVTLLALILSNHLPMKIFYSAAKWACGGITAVLAVTLCVECVVTNGLQDKLNVAVTTKNQLEMSQDRNFIILVLDSVDTGIFHEVLNDHPEYKKVFADFTYYPDTVGAYPYTGRSIPFIISGEWFENREPFEEYEEEMYKNSELFAGLESRDYKLGIYEPKMPLTDRSIFRFDNVFEYDVKVKSYLDFADAELKLSGFKYAPFAFKKLYVVDTDDFDSIRKAEDAQYQHLDWHNEIFYDNIRYGDVTYTEQKCFKFIHLGGAHVPFKYNKDLERIENGTYEQNIEACITVTKTYLEKLKEAGVYDNSVIIVMADHGFNWEETHGRQDPLLLVKGVDEKHDMQISGAPISYEDLQGAYKRLMGGKTGDDVFDWKEGDKRERRYLMYGANKDVNHTVEYIQKGQASDVESMRPTGQVFDQ